MLGFIEIEMAYKEGRIVPGKAADRAMLKVFEGALLRRTTLASGYVTPDILMTARNGTLVPCDEKVFERSLERPNKWSSEVSKITGAFTNFLRPY